jgi:hypothetical protein
VIPESIGNTEHILPHGVVCDKCNDYFARKVEKPLLETPYFRELCYIGRIRNKKGHPPFVEGIYIQGCMPVNLFPDMDYQGASIGASYPNLEKRLIESLCKFTHGTIVVPIPTEPNEQLLSRFLAKVALESLALRLINTNVGLTEITSKRELDPIRDYARRGNGVRVWPYYARRLYPLDFLFFESGEAYEVLHEWTFLYTDSHELYLILALFGVEYAINLGGPEIDGYKRWLAQNFGRSPLYPTGIKGIKERNHKPNSK